MLQVPWEMLPTKDVLYILNGFEIKHNLKKVMGVGGFICNHNKKLSILI
jgi:hypothetical protein